MGFFKKIIEGLRKTKQAIGFKLNELFKRGIFDDEFYEELEFILLGADVGSETTENIIEELRERMRRDNVSDTAKAREYLKQILLDILGEEQFEAECPAVVMVSGVNGVGKTTTIGKLANIFVKQKKYLPVCLS